MRRTTAEGASVLRGSFDHQWVADVHYDGERRLANVPVVGPRLDEDASGAIEASGALAIVWSDLMGRAMAPREATDVFAPFGAELALYSVPSAGSVSARIPMGWFPIFDVPSARDEQQIFRGQTITTGSVIEIVFKDRFLRIQRDRFDTPGVAPSLASVYAELARLTGLQITRTVPDQPIPRTVVYEEDRLEAVYALAAVLDSTPYMTSDGTLSLRPKTPGPVVAELAWGSSVLSVGHALASDNVYNRVAFRGENEAILAVAELTSGPLRVRNVDGSRSPFGTVTKFISSQYVTTSAQAQAWAQAELQRSSRLGVVRVPVECVFNPLYELGDVISVERRNGESIVGRIVKLVRGGGSMSMELEVTP
jgi:hypothetical protein